MVAEGADGDVSIDTQHDDMVHDAQLDYYGRKLATCSSDRTIKIFDVAEGKLTPITTIAQHNGPVWQVSRSPGVCCLL
jgi:protein transport protein SEC13